MMVEIKGTSTQNVGAELMAIAIRRFLHERFPGARVVADFRFGPRSKMQRYQIDPMAPAKHGWMCRLPFLSRSVIRWADPDEVSVVLDASGFAYSSRCGWGPACLRAMAKRSARLAARGTRLIFLPQAFGPFEGAEDQAAFRTIMKNADLIFARDRQSYEFIRELNEDMSHVHLCPDFTVGVESSGSVSRDVISGPLIVPNYRMVDHHPKKHLYVPFLAHCVRYLHEKGLKPAVLLHDAKEDEQILPKLFAHLGAEIPVLRNPDPVALKAVLSRASLVIGSRFHALVGSLTQAVPAIGVGWSHKYQELFQDFGCARFLLDVDAAPDLIQERIGEALDVNLRKSIIANLEEGRSSYTAAVHKMWAQVGEVMAGAMRRLQMTV